MKPSEKKARENQRPLSSSVELSCPFCGQLGSVTIDEGGGEHQTFIEDCSECCRPRVVHFDGAAGGKRPRVWLEREDGM